jgi:hypothetical protein
VISRHGIARDPLFFALILDLVYVGRQRGQLGLAHQHLFLAGLRIDGPQLPVLAGVVALYE